MVIPRNEKKKKYIFFNETRKILRKKGSLTEEAKENDKKQFYILNLSKFWKVSLLDVFLYVARS